MKILHGADFHIRDKDIEECRKCTGAFVETAESEDLDLIVIAGDIFDSRSVRLDSEAARLAFDVVEQLAMVAPVAILLGTPFHDGHAAMALGHIVGHHNVQVVDQPKQYYLTSPSGNIYPLERIKTTSTAPPQAIISMLPTPTKQWFEGNGGIQDTDEEIAGAMGPIFAGFGATASQYKCLHILVGHWTVRGAQINESQVMIGRDIEIGKDAIALANADVVCLGHIHKMQEIGDNIFYPGSLYRLNYGEMENKGFYVHEISEVN